MLIYHDLTEDTGKPDLDAALQHHSGDKTIAYTTVNGKDIHLSYYFPAGYTPSLVYPAFVMIHGGGWSGEKIFADQGNLWQGDYLGYLARYYANRGFVAVSMNYRMAQNNGQTEGYQLIDCYDDCALGMDYILDYAEAYGIDTENVFVLGESAGGHLAAMLAASYQRENFRFRAAFPVNPITDFTTDSRWEGQIPHNSNHPALASLSFSQRSAYLSPYHRVDADTCPTVLLHGDGDTVVNPAHSHKYWEKLTQMGVDCRFHRIRDTNHAFLLAEYTDNLAACRIGVGIIDAYLDTLGYGGNA